MLDIITTYIMEGLLWPWSYGSWIYNYLCNQCLSPLMLWVRNSIRARCTALCDKDCQWLATDRWFSLGPPVSSTNETDRHHITKILLKVALSTIKQTNKNQYIMGSTTSVKSIIQWHLRQEAIVYFYLAVLENMTK